jgi:hypothetical protein
MAAPIIALNTIRCHCMTFYAQSTPAICTLPGAQNLDWSTTQRLVSLHHLDVEFASQESATKVLQVAEPLSTRVLMRTHSSRVTGQVSVGTKMMCVISDEVDKMFLRTTEKHFKSKVETQDAFVSGVLALLVLAVVLFSIGECLWER